MSSLSYITRASSSPRGKPRVWFCCHPDDQARFLEPVSKDLLAAADCAVWYDPDPAAPLSEEEQAEREAALADMQLFVMPVTTRLLTAPSPALSWQFPLAQRLHIPVLPILQEPGLEFIFNEKCGDLQCLDPNQADPTALPYSEKLKKYLDSILVGDELAAKVRAAFDAYIFLSYRKKDRRQAQALMHLIHQNDFCRDIAIWYDEFLTPGEDFNAAISQALDKSRLFVLAVTPNLLERPNYVMEEEFPRARDGGKPILPVEMDPTDRAALEKAYPGIPACALSPALPGELKAALGELAKRENDADPAHNYFIGLAYLAGIDVEVDKERGVGLIRAAARAGLPEAIEKMAVVYRTGEGVERNYRAASQWQERAVSHLEDQWEEQQTEAAFSQYAAALWDLGDKYSDLSDLAAARTVWEEDFLPLVIHGQEKGFSSAQRYLSVSCISLGDLCWAEGDLAAAQRWFKKGLELRRDLAKKTGSYQARQDLSISCKKMGAVRRAEGDLVAARGWFEVSLALDRALADESGSVLARQFLSVSYKKIGDVCRAEGNIPAAQGWFEKALSLDRNLFSEVNTPETRRDLAVSCSSLGDLCQANGDLATARRWFEESFVSFKALADETGTIQARRDLSVFYNKLGDLCQIEGDLASARRWFEASLALRCALADETGTIQARQDLSVSYNNLGDLCRAEGDLAAAHRWFEEELELTRTLASETGTIEARRSLSVNCRNLGDVCRTEGDPAAARRWFEEGLSLDRATAEEIGTPEARRDLAATCHRLGDLCKAEGDLATARRWFEESLALFRTLAEETGSFQSKRDLSVLCEKMGDVYHAAGDLPAARPLFEEALLLTQTLADESGSPDARRDLSVSCGKLGELCRTEGDLVAARHWFEKSITLCRALADETGTPLARDDLAICLYRLAVLSPEGRLELLLQAANIWQQLSEEYPTVASYTKNRDLAFKQIALRTFPS